MGPQQVLVGHKLVASSDAETDKSHPNYEMASSLRKGSYADINLYFTRLHFKKPGNDLIFGACWKPFWNPVDHQMMLDVALNTPARCREGTLWAIILDAPPYTKSVIG